MLALLAEVDRLLNTVLLRCGAFVSHLARNFRLLIRAAFYALIFIVLMPFHCESRDGGSGYESGVYTKKDRSRSGPSVQDVAFDVGKELTSFNRHLRLQTLQLHCCEEKRRKLSLLSLDEGRGLKCKPPFVL